MFELCQCFAHLQQLCYLTTVFVVCQQLFFKTFNFEFRLQPLYFLHYFVESESYSSMFVLFCQHPLGTKKSPKKHGKNTVFFTFITHPSYFFHKNKKTSKRCCFEVTYVRRFELPTPWSVAKCSIQLSYTYTSGSFSESAFNAGDRNRTGTGD